MGEKNNNRLFYTCSLIEYIGRTKKQPRQEVVSCLGEKNIERIYDYADIFHCEPIEKVAHEWIDIAKIPEGQFDNVLACHYRIPDYWDIGEVYERLIEDCYEDHEISGKYIIHGLMTTFLILIQISTISHEHILQRVIKKVRFCN